MAGRCSLCDHPQRHQIEQALAAGMAQRAIARQFTVSKSTLRRHLQHGDRTAAPGVSSVTLPAVSRHQATLRDLAREQGELLGQIDALKLQLDAVAFERNICRDLQADKRRLPDLEARVAAIQAQIATGEARLATLPSLVVQAQQALDAALQRRQEAWLKHWQWIERQRSPEAWDECLEGEGDVLAWVCATQGHYYGNQDGDPPAPPARVLERLGSWGALYQHRDRLRERLLAEYPFEEERDG